MWYLDIYHNHSISPRRGVTVEQDISNQLVDCVRDV